MCNVLVFIKPDNEHDDPKQDWSKYKAGDVVDIVEKDKLHWGAAVEGPASLGWWRAVSVPGVRKEKLAHLLESGALPLVSLMPLSAAEVKHQKRLWALDLAQLKASMTLDELLAASYQKPLQPNLSVIG
jgi:hypothetical protein